MQKYIIFIIFVNLIVNKADGYDCKQLAQMLSPNFTNKQLQNCFNVGLIDCIAKEDQSKKCHLKVMGSCLEGHYRRQLSRFIQFRQKDCLEKPFSSYLGDKKEETL